MARATIDRGPTAQQAIPAAPAAINNIGVTVQDRVGPVKVTGVIECHNGSAASRTYTGAVRVNGVQVGVTVREIEVATLLRGLIQVEHLIEAPAVGDVITLEIDADAADAASVLEAGRSAMLVEALPVNAAVMAGIGPATA